MSANDPCANCTHAAFVHSDGGCAVVLPAPMSSAVGTKCACPRFVRSRERQFNDGSLAFGCHGGNVAMRITAPVQPDGARPYVEAFMTPQRVRDEIVPELLERAAEAEAQMPRLEM